jgi:hypothetical protein
MRTTNTTTTTSAMGRIVYATKAPVLEVEVSPT